MELVTARLRLRPWREEDFEPWLALNRDPLVMEFFPSLYDREQARGVMARLSASIAERGYGLWAVEVLAGEPFIGFCGIQPVPFEAPFTPAVEIGWRLARAHWGHGYATEAARASLAYGFETVGLAEIVAMVVPANQRSISVCMRLGMRHDPADDFDHPLVAEDKLSVGGHLARRHALLRLQRR